MTKDNIIPNIEEIQNFEEYGKELMNKIIEEGVD
jgi:hypothetical protein